MLEDLGLGDKTSGKLRRALCTPGNNYVQSEHSERDEEELDRPRHQVSFKFASGYLLNSINQYICKHCDGNAVWVGGILNLG